MTDKPKEKAPARRRKPPKTAEQRQRVEDYQAAAANAIKADAATAPKQYKRPLNDPAKMEQALLQVIERMCEGESLRQICKDPAMPSVGSVLNYALMRSRPDSEFTQQFARAYEIAKQVRAEAWADELVELADGTPADKDEIARSRLRVDTRKWLLSKLLKQYGDKQRHELMGEDGGSIKTESAVTFYLPTNGREVTEEVDSD